MTRRRELPTWLIVIPVALILFHRLFLGEALFWGLPALQFIPWRSLAFDELRAGRLPLWNPYVGAGAPLLANYQTAFFYPPNWLHLVLPDHLALSAVSVGHLIWAGVGMWLFAGKVGVPGFGRGVSALAFTFSGYLIARFGTPSMVDVAAWLPWLFWAVHRLTGHRSLRSWRRDAAALAVVVAMLLLAGHAQLAFYSLVGAGLYAVWRAWRAPGQGRGRFMALALAAGAVALGAGVAAVQLLPTAELLRSSQRAGGLDYDFLANFSYGPLRGLTLLTPHFFGSPADGSYLGKGAYWEDAAYIGFLPFVLALLAVLAWLRRRKRPDRHPAFGAVPFFALLGAGALVLALGRYTPLYSVLVRHVPTFAMFQAPSRWLLLTVFALSVLTGVGTLAWGHSNKEPKTLVFWSRLAAAGGAGIVAMALVAPSFIPANPASQALVGAMVALGSWLAGSAVLTLAQPSPERDASARWWRWAVLVFIAADLCWAWNGINPTVPAAFYAPVAVEPGEGGRAYWFAEYENAVRYGRWFRFNDFRVARDGWREVRRSMLPNLNMLDGAALLNNFDPMQPGDHARYLELIEEAGPEEAGALLRAAGVGMIYGEAAPSGWTGEPGRFRAPQPAQRAWLAPRARWFASRDALEAALLDEDWAPWDTVLLEGQAPADAAREGGSGAVEVIEDAHARLLLRVEANGPAWLALADTWYPGWTATVDGEPVEVLRANLAFRAVRVPAGEHEVGFSYSPAALAAGALLTLACLAAWVALVWRPSSVRD